MVGRLKWVVGLWMVMLGTAAMGQNMPGTPVVPAPPPVAAAPGAEPATRAAVEDVMMPGGPFDGIPLADLLDYLKQNVNGFNAIVIRSPGADPSYPMFDKFAPKNVTIGQFLDLVRTSYPGVDVQRIDGRAGPLYVFHVAAAQGGGTMVQLGVPLAQGGGLVAAPGAVNPDDLPPVVRVYPLQMIVSKVADGGDTKKALDDVLSLLQAAMDQQGGKNGAVLKVHEATQMLVFKGSPAQMAVLEQALNAMEPNSNSETEKMKMEYMLDMKKQDVDRKNDQEKIADLQKRLDEAMVRSSQLQEESMELKEQLQLMTAKQAASQPKQ